MRNGIDKMLEKENINVQWIDRSLLNRSIRVPSEMNSNIVEK